MNINIDGKKFDLVEVFLPLNKTSKVSTSGHIYNNPVNLDEEGSDNVDQLPPLPVEQPTYGPSIVEMTKRITRAIDDSF